MPRLLDRYHRSDRWRGVAFPVGQHGTSTRDPLPVVQDIEEVRLSLLQIFNTALGERVMYPNFGSRLTALLWEPYDEIYSQQLAFEIRQTVEINEPRVIVESAVIDDSD